MSDGDELLYEELKRRVDYQIEANRHIEKQAGRVIRLVLTTFSILFAGITVLYTTGALDFLLSEIQIQGLNSLRDGIRSNLSLSPNYTDFVTSVLALVFSVCVGLSMSNFFYYVPLSAYNVLTVTVMEPSVDFALKKRADLQRVVEEYQAISDKNEDALRETRGYWEDCYSSLRRTVLYAAGATVFGIVLFIDQSPVIASATAAVVVLGFSVFVVVNAIRWLPDSTISTFRTYDWASETGRAITAIGAYPFAIGSLDPSFVPPNYAAVIAALGWLAVALGYHQSNQDRSSNLLVRDLVASGLLFFIFATTFSVLSPFLTEKAQYVYAVLPAVLFSVLYALIIGVIYNALQKLTEGVRMVQARFID